MSKNDRYVVKHGSDWAVKKGRQKKPEGVFGTQSAAEKAVVVKCGYRDGMENGGIPIQCHRQKTRFRLATRSTEQGGAACWIAFENQSNLRSSRRMERL